MSPLLAALAAALAVAACWELLGGGSVDRLTDAFGGGRRRVRPRRLSQARLPRGSRQRLARSGYEDRIGYGRLLLAKLAGSALAFPISLALAAMFPARLQSLVVVTVPILAFWLPDVLLTRASRRRSESMLLELPAALDLMATGATAGRGINALLADATAGTRGPLREELARVVTAIECGTPQQQAIGDLRERGSGTKLATLAVALERSRRHGSPLARSLHEQARTLRADRRRRMGEDAARAAPKMQLAVALILVPSVLLMLAAAIVAHAGALLPGL